MKKNVEIFGNYAMYQRVLLMPIVDLGNDKTAELMIGLSMEL